MGSKIIVKNLTLWYGDSQALRDISIDIPENRVTALIGPSGCGKTSLIRCFNRMNDIIAGCRVEGDVMIDGKSIYGNDTDVFKLRERVGMVFQKPNPFPKSIYENVIFGPRLQGIKDKKELGEISEKSLKSAALWDEVKERKRDYAMSLSGGQQQRLCIARAIAVEPEVILMDEPCSSLDPIATTKIEDLINNLKKRYTVIIVTHNMQQAARISDFTALLYMGELIEYQKTSTLFEKPEKELTERYITGRFG